MGSAFSETDRLTPGRAARATAIALGLTLYVAIGAAATVIYPPLAVAFLAPLVAASFAVAPLSKAAPRDIAFALILIAAALLPVWPVYIFLKAGPTPIITPPRFVLYVVSAMWLYDMAFSAMRRAQFSLAVRRSRPIVWSVFALFFLGLLSLPMAEGRALAVPEFIRQTIIWLIPFCAVLTYCRREREFFLIIKVMTVSAALVGLIAIGEAASRRLVAELLSPFMLGEAEWLQNAQLQKIRDGVFRAQGTHTHPLSLGEHMAFSAPFAFALALNAKGRGRYLWIGALLLILGGAAATSSRGAALGMGVAMAVMIAIVGVKVFRRARSARLRPLAGLVMLAAIIASPVVIYGVHGVIAGRGGVAASNSSQSRLDQIEQAWPKIMSRPVLGYGVGRSVRVLGYWSRDKVSIDNHYLSLALELGFAGPIAFFSMLAAWGIAALRRSARAAPAMADIYLACFAAAAAIIIIRSIMSPTGNLTMVYLLLAAYAGSAMSGRGCLPLRARRSWRSR